MNNFVVEDFDGLNSCGFEPDCEDVDCYINVKWFNLQNELNDEIDWRLLSGITPTPNTGPVGDHTTGTIEGNFLYLEPTGECYNKKAVLNSPCIDLGSLNNPAVSFWFSMYGAEMGQLHLDVISDGMLHKDVMTPLTGNYGNGWNEGHAYLSQFAGKEINIRFRGYTGDGELGDMAIDDIMITELTNLDEVSPGFINVFPNPSDGIVQVNLRDVGEEATVTVMDLTGRVVLKEMIETNGVSLTEYTFDISELQNGMYYLIIKSNNTVFKEKILKK